MRTPIRSVASLSLLALALAVPAPALAAGVTPTDATPVQREEAQTHFARARDLYTAKKYDDAHDEFAKSYAIVASPNALFFEARCDRDRGKLVAAYAEYGRAVAEAKEHASEDPRYAKTADAAGDERDAVASQLGFVTIAVDRATPETTVSIGGERFTHAEWGEPVPLLPGTSDVVVTTPGKTDVRQQVSVTSGERKTLSLDAGPDVASPQASDSPTTPKQHQDSPEDEERSRAKLRTAAYVTAGVGVAGIATFAIFGLMSNAKYNDLQNECHGPCTTPQGNQISAGKTDQTVADIGLAVGLVGAAASVVLFVMSIPTKSETVSVVAGPTWMGVQGRF